MNKKLKRLIKEHWGVSYKQLNKDLPLITLAEQIACDTESCTIEEAYKMYIDKPELHLPGLIALYIIDEMGMDCTQVNAGMTLRELFDL